MTLISELNMNIGTFDFILSLKKNVAKHQTNSYTIFHYQHIDGSKRIATVTNNLNKETVKIYKTT